MSNSAEDQAWRRQHRIAIGKCGRCNRDRLEEITLCALHAATRWTRTRGNRQDGRWAQVARTERT